jgi:Fe-S oxidoreductase
MLASAAPFATIACLLGGLVAAAWQTRRWLQGAPANVDLLGGLLAMPRRYLVDVHDVVARRPRNSRFHALTAGGFLASLALLILLAIPALRFELLWLALALALALMLAGALMVQRRRQVDRPAELSGGMFDRLPLALILYALGFLVFALAQLVTGPVAVLASSLSLIVGTFGLIGIVSLAIGGPLKHAINGMLHLAFHPRPARFTGEKRDTALQPLDLAAGKLGAETPVDFAWNRLLAFDACVQCGRCEQVCPAYAAEQPLNPKKLIQDLAMALAPAASDAAYAGNDHPGHSPGMAHGGAQLPLIGAAIAAETLWSCTTCRACVHECPMMIEHVDAVIDLRRFQTLELGALPGKAAAMLEDLRYTDTVSGRAPAARLDWAADLAMPLMRDLDETDILLWLGDAAFDLRAQRTLRALVRLLKRANVAFATLGEEELDSGDSARRLGDEAAFQDLAQRNIATLSRYRFRRIVTADPHSLHALKNEYPALGGRYEVVHHTTFLADLVERGTFGPIVGDGRKVTYHDPCYLGRYNGETAAPRALLDALGVERVEMERSGLRSQCCGGGGGAPLTDIPGKRRIPDIRMAQAIATGAEVLAVACPTCTVMLEGVTGKRPEVLDVAELLWSALERAPIGATPRESLPA